MTAKGAFVVIAAVSILFAQFSPSSLVGLVSDLCADEGLVVGRGYQVLRREDSLGEPIERYWSTFRRRATSR